MFIPNNNRSLQTHDINLSMLSFDQISRSLNNIKGEMEQSLHYISQLESAYSEVSKRQRACSEKLAAISELQDNWNDNGAQKFSDKLIVKCYSILYKLPVLPEIFPVADGSVQFEYKKSDGSYLEFDISENEIVEFRAYPDGKEIERAIDNDNISEEVKNFYERTNK